jgi:hypothetical protein
MTRLLKVAAAQVGAVHRSTPRKEVLDRLISLLEQASKEQVQLVVFREPSREPADAKPKRRLRRSSPDTTFQTRPSSLDISSENIQAESHLA